MASAGLIWPAVPPAAIRTRTVSYTHLGGVATAGSQLQYNYDVDGSFRSSAMGTLEGMMNFWQTLSLIHI